jgi:hypothetical protein
MSSGANVNIGRNSTQTSRWFNGRIEECRISNVARSDDWIETEYNNQNDPSSFYTVAGEEILNSPIINPGETTQTSFGTSHIVNTPTNSEGDVIYIYAGIDDHVDMIAPAGFSQAFQNFKAFNNQATHSLWYKTATGSEPSTYTWTSSISQGSTSISWSVSNDDGINVVSSNNSGQSNTAIAGDATTTVNNCLVLRLVVTEEATLPHGTFSNHTLLDSIENVGEVSISAQYKIQKNAGAVGQAQIPLNSVDDWSGMTVCISPSPTHQPIIFDDITFERSVKGDGSSISIDVGQPGNNRLIIVAFDVEDSHGSNFLRSVTIDGKPFTPQAVADNPDGLGNHQEVHTIHEDTLTSTSGVQNIVFSGGNTNWETHVHVYYGVDSNTPIDSGIEETVVGGTIAVENISSNNGSLIFMGAASGTGESSGAGSITAPLVVREQGATNGQRAYFSTLSGIETSGQTNKTYSLIMQGSNLRETGIVLVFDPAESVFTGVTSYHQMIL